MMAAHALQSRISHLYDLQLVLNRCYGDSALFHDVDLFHDVGVRVGLPGARCQVPAMWTCYYEDERRVTQ